MPRYRIVLAVLGLFALGGCVAYPVDGGYAQPGPFYAAPPSVYIGGGYGGYRPYYGGYRHGYRGGGHHGGGHRGWR